MGCNCGGRAGAVAATVMAGGSATVWRLTHPNGATVDYWTEDGAKGAMAATPGSTYQKVDHRTGLPVT